MLNFFLELLRILYLREVFIYNNCNKKYKLKFNLRFFYIFQDQISFDIKVSEFDFLIKSVSINN